ncbi:MAG TPA: hypothetical protein VFL38_17190 [Humibacillus xanthopallidus]|nr:hypothetical protein [Humibacillus xanthopallidus]
MHVAIPRGCLMLPYLAYGASLLAVTVLVIADTKIGIPLAERVLLAAFWPVLAALYWWRVSYLQHDPVQMAWLGAIGYSTIVVTSLGRPILIMWDAIPGRARSDRRLVIRSRIVTAAFLIVGAVLVIVMEFRP